MGKLKSRLFLWIERVLLFEMVLMVFNNPEQVAEAVWQIYFNEEYAMQLKRNAYLSVCEKYDIRRVAEQHVSMFNDIVKDNK